FFPRRPEAPAGRPSPRRARAPGPAQAPRPGPGPAGQMSGLPCCRASLRSRKNPRVMAIRTPRTVTGHIRTYPVSNQVMMFSFPEMTKWELSWRAATAGSARDGGGGFLGLLIEVPGDLPDPCEVVVLRGPDGHQVADQERHGVADEGAGEHLVVAEVVEAQRDHHHGGDRADDHGGAHPEEAEAHDPQDHADADDRQSLDPERD